MVYLPVNIYCLKAAFLFLWQLISTENFLSSLFIQVQRSISFMHLYDKLMRLVDLHIGK